MKNSVAKKQKDTHGKKKKKIEGSLLALYILAGILALGLLIFGAVMMVRGIYTAYLDSGKAYRRDIVLKTEHQSINAAMLSYRFYDAFYTGLLEENYDDPDSLKSVASPIDGINLFEYDELRILRALQQTILYAEKAAVNGVELTEKDKEAIEAKLRAIEKAGQSRDMETDDYLSATYGRGVKLSDISDMLSLEKLADRQRALDEIGVDVSDEELAEYLAKLDPSAYLRIDYYIVNFTGNLEEGDDETIRDLKTEIAFEYAKELAESKSLEEFRQKALTLIKKDHANEGLTDEMAKEILEDDHMTARRFITPDDDAPASTKWLFSLDRRDNDIYSDNDSPAVYYIEHALYSIDTPNDAFLVIDLQYDNYESRSAALERFNEVEDDFEKSGKTEEDFRALACANAENIAAAAREGYYDNTASSSSFNDLVSNLQKSLNEKGESLTIGQSYELYGENAVYLVYYLGKAGARSQIEAREAIISNKCYDLYSAMLKNITLDYTDKGEVRIADRYQG